MRTAIIEAALRVASGGAGNEITYESVSREVGLTKAGLMYHFRTKEALMVAVVEHVVDRWETELVVTLGMPLEESTLAQRVRAFVLFASAGGVTGAEFVIFAEAVRRPELSAPWLDYLQTWFDFGNALAAMPLLVVWLSANGLWLTESTGIITVTPDQRTELVTLLAALIAPDAH